MIRYQLHLVCPQTLKLSQGLSLLLFNPSNFLSQNRKCSQMKSGDEQYRKVLERRDAVGVWAQ